MSVYAISMWQVPDTTDFPLQPGESIITRRWQATIKSRTELIRR